MTQLRAHKVKKMLLIHTFTKYYNLIFLYLFCNENACISKVRLCSHKHFYKFHKKFAPFYEIIIIYK